MTIKEIRIITGLSQKKFGERYHIPTRTIENWESPTIDKQPPTYVIELLERVVKEDYKESK